MSANGRGMTCACMQDISKKNLIWICRYLTPTHSEYLRGEERERMKEERKKVGQKLGLGAF